MHKQGGARHVARCPNRLARRRLGSILRPPAGQPSQPESASLSAAPDAVGAAGTVTRAVAHDSDVLGRAVAHAESMTVSEDIEMMMTGIDSLRHVPWAK